MCHNRVEQTTPKYQLCILKPWGVAAVVEIFKFLKKKNIYLLYRGSLWCAHTLSFYQVLFFGYCDNRGHFLNNRITYEPLLSTLTCTQKNVTWRNRRRLYNHWQALYQPGYCKTCVPPTYLDLQRAHLENRPREQTAFSCSTNVCVNFTKSYLLSWCISTSRTSLFCTQG